MDVLMCECRDNWYTFSAYSNVLWIHYLIGKLLKDKMYKTHQNNLIRQLRSVHRELLAFNSAIQLITSCNFFL